MTHKALFHDRLSALNPAASDKGKMFALTWGQTTDADIRQFCKRPRQSFERLESCPRIPGNLTLHPAIPIPPPKVPVLCLSLSPILEFIPGALKMAFVPPWLEVSGGEHTDDWHPRQADKKP